MNSQSGFTIKLFYSYSHKDAQHREKMEKSLTLLRDQDGILDDWSDQQNPFFRKVISIRTQLYLNTHQVKVQIKQRVCSLLNIKYQPRIKG